VSYPRVPPSLHSPRHHRDLHSFPTRRSSDLELLSGDTFGTDADGNGIHFQKAYIPLNSRAGLEHKDYSLNQYGIPCCPNNTSLRSEEHTSELQSRFDLVCRLLLERKNKLHST